MSKIFDAANAFSIDRYPNVYSTTSIGGHARVETAGLSFYYVSSTLPPMYEEDYREVEAELLSLQDGATLLTSGVPNEHTRFVGSWAGNPSIIGSAGRVVNLAGFDGGAEGVARAGDWLQFTGANGGTKVYQVVNTVDADTFGRASITVHTDFVTQPNASTVITRGESVEFRLLLTEKPSVATRPGHQGVPLYQFTGPFIFREVL